MSKNTRAIKVILTQEWAINVARNPKSYTVSQVNEAALYLANRVERLERAIESALNTISEELFRRVTSRK